MKYPPYKFGFNMSYSMLSFLLWKHILNMLECTTNADRGRTLTLSRNQLYTTKVKMVWSCLSIFSPSPNSLRTSKVFLFISSQISLRLCTQRPHSNIPFVFKLYPFLSIYDSLFSACCCGYSRKRI